MLVSDSFLVFVFFELVFLVAIYFESLKVFMRAKGAN